MIYNITGPRKQKYHQAQAGLVVAAGEGSLGTWEGGWVGVLGVVYNSQVTKVQPGGWEGGGGRTLHERWATCPQQ